MIRSRDLDKNRFEFTTTQSIILLLLYFVGYYLGASLLGLFLTNLIFKTTGSIHPSIMMALILILLFTSYYIVRDPLKYSFNHFKKNLQFNISSVSKNFMYLWIFSILSNMVIVFLLGDRSSENQMVVEEGIRSAPVLYAVMVMFFAPLVEELIFRGVLYQKFRSEKSFIKAILISTLIFGLFHVLPAFIESMDWTEFLFLIQYAGLSFFMIRCFEETSSIWGSISVHFLNNALGFLMVFLIA